MNNLLGGPVALEIGLIRGIGNEKIAQPLTEYTIPLVCAVMATLD